MARISKIERSARFAELKEVARSLNETNDCGVVATALISRVSYPEAHAKLDELGRAPRRGTPMLAIKQACNRFGHNLLRAIPQEHRVIIESFPGQHWKLKNITTHHPRRFPEAFEGAPDMLIISQRHISAFIDGEIHDWAINNALRAISIYYRESDSDKFNAWIDSRRAARNPNIDLW